MIEYYIGGMLWWHWMIGFTIASTVAELCSSRKRKRIIRAADAVCEWVYDRKAGQPAWWVEMRKRTDAYTSAGGAEFETKRP